MTYEELEAHLMDFFSDTSRSSAETKSDLLALAEEARSLADTITDPDEYPEELT